MNVGILRLGVGVCRSAQTAAFGLFLPRGVSPPRREYCMECSGERENHEQERMIVFPSTLSVLVFILMKLPCPSLRESSFGE